MKLSSGGWFEKATREVVSNFLENPTVNGSSNWGISGATPEALGEAIFSTINGGNTRESTNDSTREIQAGSFGLKATLWDQLDLLGGLRVEDIRIESQNEPYTGTARYGAPATFPDVYVFFDRIDNPYREGISNIPANATYNDQLLGIDVPVGPCRRPDGTIPNPALQCVDLWTPGDPTDRSAIDALVNGTIDELKLLPAAGFNYRPIEGMSVRGAWSQTVARPSFREMGFYASVELGTDDLVVGNPQLTLSDVESWDARIEYNWGELGDLAALSGFYKIIERPIESIVVRNPIVAEGNALWRTFFNNPNTAKLWGLELEARKNLGFFGPELLEYLSLGGNFTYIHATVDRTEAELARAQLFFQTTPDAAPEYFDLESSRRLFGQPEWIVNADISFDQPDWGTRLTLSVFAISDLLDAAGTASTGPDGRITSLTLDRYIDSFYTMDLVFSQTLPVRRAAGAAGAGGDDPQRAHLQDQHQEPHRQHPQDRVRPRPDQPHGRGTLLQGGAGLLLLADLLLRLLTFPARSRGGSVKSAKIRVKPATRSAGPPHPLERPVRSSRIAGTSPRGDFMNPSSTLRGQMSENRRCMAADRKTARKRLLTLPPSVPSPFGSRHRNPTPTKGLHNHMQTKFSAIAVALALGVLAYASGAGATIRPSETDAETCFASRRSASRPPTRTRPGATIRARRK